MGSTMSMNMEKVKHPLFRVRKLAMKFYVECPFYVTAYYGFSRKLSLGETISALQFHSFPVVYRVLLLFSLDCSVNI